MIGWLRAKFFPAPKDRDAIRKAAAIALQGAQVELAASRKARAEKLSLGLAVKQGRGTHGH